VLSCLCRAVLYVAVALVLSPFGASAQRIAFVFPEKETDTSFAEKIIDVMPERVTVIDASLGAAATRALRIENAANMATAEARNLGDAIGTDFIVVFSGGLQRRAVSGAEPVFEAYAVARLVSARTGRLVQFEVYKHADRKPAEALRKLMADARSAANSLLSTMEAVRKKEAAEPEAPVIEEIPDVSSPAARNFKPPIPYRRIKPSYTPLASLYGVAATVEILVDLDPEGKVTRTEIARWAGFGLDESVDAAVRAMNWRPAHRDGKPLAIRALLRYNFKRLDAAQ
jgi:hypothetical protein